MKNIVLILSLLLATASFAGVDTKKSSFKWHGTKVTGAHEGNISIKTAEVNLNEAGKISDGTIVMDMKSITVTDLSGEFAQKFINHVTTGDFFEVNKYPTATLKISRDTGKFLEGKMTIKGVTNQIKIPYTKEGNVFKGKMTFDRTKYGIKYGSGSFFKGLGDKMIHDEVTVDFNVAVTK